MLSVKYFKRHKVSYSRGQGNSYTRSERNTLIDAITPNQRPPGLLAASSNNWYARAKPQYESLPVSSFVSARSAGATGDGTTDDTAALQAAIQDVANKSIVLFLDQGSYKVTKALYIPNNTKIVGKNFPTIFATGKYFFADINNT